MNAHAHRLGCNGAGRHPTPSARGEGWGGRTGAGLMTCVATCTSYSTSMHTTIALSAPVEVTIDTFSCDTKDFMLCSQILDRRAAPSVQHQAMPLAFDVHQWPSSRSSYEKPFQVSVSGSRERAGCYRSRWVQSVLR